MIMKQDLETVRLELEEYLSKKPFVVFHGYSRMPGELPNSIQWDTLNHPDFHGFLEVAEKLQVPVINVHTSRLTEDEIDEAVDQITELDMPFDERRELERRLKELRMYAGFTGEIELSFDHGHQVYYFSRMTDWYSEAMALIDELETTFLTDAVDDDPYGNGGGYFSKN